MGRFLNITYFCITVTRGERKREIKERKQELYEEKEKLSSFTMITLCFRLEERRSRCLLSCLKFRKRAVCRWFSSHKAKIKTTKLEKFLIERKSFVGTNFPSHFWVGWWVGLSPSSSFARHISRQALLLKDWNKTKERMKFSTCF